MHFCLLFLFLLVGCMCVNACVSVRGAMCTRVRVRVCVCVCARVRVRACVCNVTLESDFVGSTSYLITEYKLESEVRLSNCGMTAPRRRYFRKDAQCLPWNEPISKLDLHAYTNTGSDCSIIRETTMRAVKKRGFKEQEERDEEKGIEDGYRYR